MRTEFLHLTVTATAHYTNKKTGLEGDLLDITGPRDLMQGSRPLLLLSCLPSLARHPRSHSPGDFSQSRTQRPSSHPVCGSPDGLSLSAGIVGS